MAAHSLSSKIFHPGAFHEGEPRAATSWLRGAVQRFESWVAWRSDYRTTVRELGDLSNRELDDIGIIRYDIPSIARQSADMAAASRR